MTQYRYEYGKRWDARLPHYAIASLVDRQHVSMADQDLATIVAEHCGSNWPAHLKVQAIVYAHVVHNRNRDLYRHVMQGAA